MTEKANKIYNSNSKIIDIIIKTTVNKRYNGYLGKFFSKEELEQECRLKILKELDNFDKNEVSLESFVGQISKYRIQNRG